MKAKKLKEALQQLAEEGVVQVFRPHDGSPALVGVVGPLQLDVLRVRLKDEYGLEVLWDAAEFELARWISSGRSEGAGDVRRRQPAQHRRRSRRRPGVPGRATSSISTTPRERAPGIVFTDIKDQNAVKAA